MTRSASAALPTLTHSLTHPLVHSLITGETETERKEKDYGSENELQRDTMVRQAEDERGRGCVCVCEKVCERRIETLMDGSGDEEIELSETNQSPDIKRGEGEIGRRFPIGSPTYSISYSVTPLRTNTLQVTRCTFPFALTLTQKRHHADYEES